MRRIRNKLVWQFFDFVLEQKPKRTIDNSSFETCAIGAFAKTIGLSFKGQRDFMNTPTCNEKTCREKFSGWKIVDAIGRYGDLQANLFSKYYGFETYGRLQQYIREHYTR
jgi:hypothetical protein